MRKDLKIKRIIDLLGMTLTFIGLAGLAGASEGEGSAFIAILTFSIGFGLVLWGYKR